MHQPKNRARLVSVSVPKQKLCCDGYNRKWQCCQVDDRGIFIGRGVAIDTISFGGMEFSKAEQNDSVLRTIRNSCVSRSDTPTQRRGYKIYYHHVVIKNTKREQAAPPAALSALTHSSTAFHCFDSFERFQLSASSEQLPSSRVQNKVSAFFIG